MASAATVSNTVDSEFPVTLEPLTLEPVMPAYPAGSLIRYYLDTHSGLHYTVIILKTGEALQVKSADKTVKGQITFPSFKAWYDTLPGSPNIDTFDVTLGKGAPIRSTGIEHLTSLPKITNTHGDIFAWNRTIVKVLLELAPDLVHSRTFVENYNKMVSLLVKYMPNLMTSPYTYIKQYDPKLLSMKPSTLLYGWMESLPVLWYEDYTNGRICRDMYSLSAEERNTAKEQIVASCKMCIETIAPYLTSRLTAKREMCDALTRLRVSNKVLKHNSYKYANLEYKYKEMAKIMEHYESEVSKYTDIVKKCEESLSSSA